MTDSQKLLADYAANGSEAAFRELVSRYIDLLFSTALRSVGGDAHRAQDVVQTVFTDLARQAPKLPADTMLGGWLHRNACFVAAKLMRGERRRQIREREAAEMNALNRDETAWADIGPVLDEAINELAEEDRRAILFRFYERMDLRAIGEALGGSENAAQKRVSRALEKLQGLLKRRGITSTAAALSVALSANAVQTAPAGLAACVSTTALAGAALSTATAIAVTKTIAMTTIQKGLIAASVAVLAGAGIYEARQASRLRSRVEALQQQQAPLDAQAQQWRREREELTDRLAALQTENAELKSGRNSNELLRLRGEVGRLRAELKDASPSKATNALDRSTTSDLDRVSRIKQLVAQWPNLSIPEYRLLQGSRGDAFWEAQAKNPLVHFETEEDLRRSLAFVRQGAKGSFVSMMRRALDQYTAANNGQLPGDLSELNPFFPQPVDPAMLERYQLLHSGNLSDYPDSEPLVTEKAPVDSDYDLLYQFNTHGYNVQGVGKMDGFSMSGSSSGNSNIVTSVIKHP